MKNRMRRIAFTAMAAAVAMSTSIPAFAASLDFTDESNNGHTYGIYQIFTGNINGDNELSNIRWGADSTGYDASKTEQDLVDVVTLKALEDAVSLQGTQAKLNVITEYYNAADTTPEGGKHTFTEGMSKDARVIKDLADGYYLIKDEAATEGTHTSYIVEIAGKDVKVTPKVVNEPGFDKQVWDEDNTDQTANPAAVVGDNGYWGETADHSIGEVFQFRLKATLPENELIDTYKAYYLQFTDTLSKEVTYVGKEKLKVTVKDSTGVTGNMVLDTDFTATEPVVADEAGNQNWTITITDLKAALKRLGLNDSLQGVEVIVTYDAYLNENAIVSESSATLTKGDNTNTAKLTYSNNPEYNGSGTPGTRTTEEDTVFVFTYDFDNFKTMQDGKTALKDAKFEIYAATVNGSGETVKSGDAIPLVASTASDGSTVYRRATIADATTTTTMESPENGKFTVSGLDAGKYILVESKAPNGYTEAADMLITISATHEETDTTTASVTMTRNLNDSTKNLTLNTIINKKGSKLPTTGGMGTTLLYTVGGLLVVGAGSMLVSKKRIRK